MALGIHWLGAPFVLLAFFMWFDPDMLTEVGK